MLHTLLINSMPTHKTGMVKRGTLYLLNISTLAFNPVSMLMLAFSSKHHCGHVKLYRAATMAVSLVHNLATQKLFL